MSQDSIDPNDAQKPRAEEMRNRYNQHLQEEERHGPSGVNGHPDGCWFCGALGHHSDCCPKAERRALRGMDPVTGVRHKR